MTTIFYEQSILYQRRDFLTVQTCAHFLIVIDVMTLGGVDEGIPCIAGDMDDGGVVLKDPIGEVVGSQILPDILDRVQFVRFRLQ